MNLDDLFPGLSLNRPEYPSNPELLPSALGQSLFPEARERDESGKTRGHVYRRLVDSRSQKMVVHESRPSPERLAEALANNGVEPMRPGSLERPAQSLIDSLEGTRPQKAKGIAACPVSPTTLFLQDARGLQNKTNPPNFASIIEGIWRAGSAKWEADRAAARMLYSAIQLDTKSSFLQAIDRAIGETALLVSSSYSGSPPEVLDLEFGQESRHSHWIANGATPQRWFAQAWAAFCSPDWRRNLPARRWADWASCILRTGVALSYLYEARFYADLGRYLLDCELNSTNAWDRLVVNPDYLLRWGRPSEKLSVQDQNQRMRATVAAGVGVRAEVKALVDQAVEAPFSDSEGLNAKKLAEVIDWLRERTDDETLRAVRESYGVAPKGSAKNTMETIGYLLQTRQKSGREADFYGMLDRRSRRFLVLDPGEEWVVVFASLAAKKPGGEVVLREIREQLRWLGVEADRDAVVRELERAGLSRSSHDADDAIIVRAGF